MVQRALNYSTFARVARSWLSIHGAATRLQHSEKQFQHRARSKSTSAPRTRLVSSNLARHQASSVTHPALPIDKNLRRARASRQKDVTPVPDLSSLVASSLAGYYEEVRGRLHQWVAPLSTDQLWRKPYPYGNSIGHLLLHLTGNLNYYVGAQIAGTGYVRDRDREFNEPRRLPKEQVLADFDRAIALVAATIRQQSAEDFAKPYAAALETEAHDRFTVFVRMAAHAYHHVGQIIYLAKEVARPAP
jgi:uncharacterized damage-inducible protein DinB